MGAALDNLGSFVFEEVDVENLVFVLVRAFFEPLLLAQRLSLAAIVHAGLSILDFRSRPPQSKNAHWVKNLWVFCELIDSPHRNVLYTIIEMTDKEETSSKKK